MNSAAVSSYRIIGIFTRILGGATFSSQFEKYLRDLPNTDVTIINYDASIYNEQPTPKILKLSDALQSAWRIKGRVKRRGVDLRDFDLLLFQGYQLTIPFLSDIKIKRAILALDSTPILASTNNLRASKIEAYSYVSKLMTHSLNTIFYRRVFKEVDFFLARTELVKKSLMNDYQISPDRISVTYLPVEPEKAESTQNSEKLELLFVGNDWRRKGGEFLQALFDRELASIANLTIVSGDSGINHSLFSEPVTLKSGLDNTAVRQLMANMDVLLFPSWKDELGLVLVEAAASGMALIARSSGAQEEIVAEGENGYLMSYDSEVELWRQKIRQLHTDRVLLQKMKENSAKLGKEKFSRESFNAALDKAFVYVSGKSPYSKR